MATLPIKNLPDDVYEQLKRRAACDRRGVNSEVIVTEEDLRAAKDKGRL